MNKWDDDVITSEAIDSIKSLLAEIEEFKFKKGIGADFDSDKFIDFIEEELNYFIIEWN